VTSVSPTSRSISSFFCIEFMSLFKFKISPKIINSSLCCSIIFSFRFFFSTGELAKASFSLYLIVTFQLLLYEEVLEVSFKRVHCRLTDQDSLQFGCDFNLHFAEESALAYFLQTSISFLICSRTLSMYLRGFSIKDSFKCNLCLLKCLYSSSILKQSHRML
jgi:hypothetical protein